MMDTYSDGLGGIDFERSQHGSGMSKKAQAKKFISVLNRKAAESYRRYLAEPRKLRSDLTPAGPTSMVPRICTAHAGCMWDFRARADLTGCVAIQSHV